MNVSIVRRKLTPPEIFELIENIRLFPNLAYVSPRRWKQFINPYCLLLDGHLAGVCQIYSFNKWIKLGPLVLLAKHQGKGLGKLLLTKIITNHKNRHIFIVSSNPKVQHIIECNNFQRISDYFSLPKEVQLFLIKQLIEHLNLLFLIEIIRKKLFSTRGETRLYIKHP